MKITTNIEEKKIAYLIASGMEGGINYWAKIAEYKKPTNPFPFCDSNRDYVAKEEWEIFPHIDYPLSEDGAVVIKDIESHTPDTLYTIDRKAILNGLQVMANKYPKHFANFMEDNGDATTGDVFIQCCVFNEIIYG